jgi:hypothetical protein
MMFLRPFVANNSAISCVTASPTDPTLTQSARAVAESAQITAVAAKPSFKERICPSEKSSIPGLEAS